jgi:hypothetical protein
VQVPEVVAEGILHVDREHRLDLRALVMEDGAVLARGAEADAFKQDGRAARVEMEEIGDVIDVAIDREPVAVLLIVVQDEIGGVVYA